MNDMRRKCMCNTVAVLYHWVNIMDTAEKHSGKTLTHIYLSHKHTVN